MGLTGTAIRRGTRNHVLDVLRLVFAALVILGHAGALTPGLSSEEFLARTSRYFDVNIATASVDGFFLLSGFLILQSWQADPKLLNYLRKRVLRIVPGFVVAVALSVLAAGLVAPGVPHFFHHLRGRFVFSVLRLDSTESPPVFPGLPFHGANGSLWSIAYEFRCYLLVALWGILGLLRYRVLWLAATLFLLFAMTHPAFVDDHLIWPDRAYAFTGSPLTTIRLTAAFLVGGCYFLFRDKIALRWPLGILAFAALLLAAIRFPLHFEFALIVFGGYLMFYLAQLPSLALHWMERTPDVSYGVYLYGWPVEQLWIWYHRQSPPMLTFAVSLAICLVLGWISWHFVERPMLKLKRGSAAPLPPP